MKILARCLTYIVVTFLFTLALFNPAHPFSHNRYAPLKADKNILRKSTLRESLSGSASQDNVGDLIPLYLVRDLFTPSISEAEAEANIRKEPIYTYYVPNAPLRGEVPLYRLRNQKGHNHYATSDSKRDYLIRRYSLKLIGQVAWVYPKSAWQPGMTCNSTDAVNPDFDYSFCVWETKEGSRRTNITAPNRSGVRRSASQRAKTQPNTPPDPIWLGTPAPVYASNDCSVSKCPDVVQHYVIEIPDGSAYVRHVIERTTENPRGENNGKWRICDGLIPGRDGRVKGVWIEVRAGSRNSFGPRVWIGANLKVLTQPGQASSVCKDCSFTIGCNRDKPSPISSVCQTEGVGRILTFLDGGTGTSISEMSITNASTGSVTFKEWANTTSGMQNAIHFAVTCQEAGVRCCLNDNMVYMYGTHFFHVKGPRVSLKDF